MPTIAAEAVPALIAMAAGSVVGGVGSGIGSSLEADAEKEAANTAALGPVRGGTDRAGNKGAFPRLDASTLSKLGENTMPMRQPVIGGSNMPIDLSKLYQPKPFGQGFTGFAQNTPKLNW